MNPGAVILSIVPAESGADRSTPYQFEADRSQQVNHQRNGGEDEQ
jgi:hypothetical protein